MVKKTLRKLSKAWRPKVIVIQEAKDLNVLSLDALSVMKPLRRTIGKGKSIALKST